MKILAIDIGGTNIKYVLQEDGKIIDKGSTKSEANLGAEKLLSNVFSLCDKFSFSALGVSTAGIVGNDGEIVYANDNIPNYTGVKLREILQNRYNVKVKVLNDIYASALSELDENNRNYYFIALGTGVGGVYVLNGKPLMGNGFFAGQIGYLPNKDRSDIIDRTASTLGLERLANENAKILFDKCYNGDKEAEKFIGKWAEDVVYLLSLIVGFFNPKKIVLGGGITKQGDRLINELSKKFSLLPKPYQNSFTLSIAKEDNYSGSIGALKYILED